MYNVTKSLSLLCFTNAFLKIVYRFSKRGYASLSSGFRVPDDKELSFFEPSLEESGDGCC